MSATQARGGVTANSTPARNAEYHQYSINANSSRRVKAASVATVRGKEVQSGGGKGEYFIFTWRSGIVGARPAGSAGGIIHGADV